jgi:acetyltransferase EpsM
MGEYAVLAAGAVAFKDIEPHSTWIGNPARRAV